MRLQGASRENASGALAHLSVQEIIMATKQNLAKLGA
jgi:hypothetical protein